MVVGAGLAGLTAARELRRAGKSVLVLEAATRAGGRVWSHPLGGGEVSERGGTFVGPTQDHVIDLAKAYGIDTFPTYNEGNNVAYIEGDRVEWSDTGPTGTAPPDPAILPELAATVALLDEMSKEVPVDAPWNAAKALEYDGQTLETWIKDNSTTQRYRNLVPLATRPIFGTEPRDLSLLFVLFYIAASGDETERGHVRAQLQHARRRAGVPLRGQHERAGREDGRRARPQAPAAAAGPPDRPGREGRARRHRQALGQREARDRRGAAGARRPDRLPAAPAVRARPAHAAHGPGNAHEGQRPLRDAVLARRRVHRDRPVHEAASCRRPSTARPRTADPVWSSASWAATRRASTRRLSKSERRSTILGEFAQFWGAEAESPEEYWDTRWPAQRWNRGGPVGIHGPGSLVANGPALRVPVGRIHWASTETSTYWNGYMDGAVRSGERAAAEVLAEL